MEQGVYLILKDGTTAKTAIEELKKFLKSGIADALLCDTTVFSKNDLATLRDFVQEKGIAFIVKGDADVEESDGVHIDYCGKELQKIRKKLGDKALGVVCATRDEAMNAGEYGADYIAFAGEDAADLTEWWADLFNVPCVCLDITTPCPSADFRIVVLGG